VDVETHQVLCAVVAPERSQVVGADGVPFSRDGCAKEEKKAERARSSGYMTDFHTTHELDALHTHDIRNLSNRKFSSANLVLLHANLAYATKTKDSGKTHNDHPSK
jgi:hypothetical protein